MSLRASSSAPPYGAALGVLLKTAIRPSKECDCLHLNGRPAKLQTVPSTTGGQQAAA